MEIDVTTPELNANLVAPSTLPHDSQARKRVPLYSGVIAYFPAALAGVARVSFIGNEKHNPGQPLHHSRDASSDHADCIMRHLIDLGDHLARAQRSCNTMETDVDDLLTEASALAWRALALSQELHEKYRNAPLAPGAKRQAKLTSPINVVSTKEVNGQ
jgi:hypothetical protein